MTDEREIRYFQYLAWERDSLNRLYYSLWILFMGGFVYSLHLPPSHHPCIVFYGAGFLRVLAILGTGINFWMQYHALGSVSHTYIARLKESQGDKQEASRRQELAVKADKIVGGCEKPLQWVGVFFLLTALFLSFFS